MPDGFEVEPAVQQGAARQFARASDELSAALDELSLELASLAGMCGDDEHGRAFAAKWERKAEELTTAVGDAAGGVAVMSERVGAMAAGYIRCEDANERMCRSNIGLRP